MFTKHGLETKKNWMRQFDENWYEMAQNQLENREENHAIMENSYQNDLAQVK